MEGRVIRRSRRWVSAQNRGKRLLGMWPFLRVLTFEHMIFNDLSMQNALAAYIAISLRWPGRVQQNDCHVLPKKGVWNLCSFMDFMDDKVYSKRCIKKEWHRFGVRYPTCQKDPMRPNLPWILKFPQTLIPPLQLEFRDAPPQQFGYRCVCCSAILRPLERAWKGRQTSKGTTMEIPGYFFEYKCIRSLCLPGGDLNWWYPFPDCSFVWKICHPITSYGFIIS